MIRKRDAFECFVRLAAALSPSAAAPPAEPRSIFVLRNNDIGDLLVVTPLFEALKRHFPSARIVAGVGAWNADVLHGNPFVDEVLPVNAPWHNQRVQPQSLAAALRYLAWSPEVTRLRERQCDLGIDVLGSQFGSLLMLRAGIPFRLGVKGYAGGHSAAQRCVEHDPAEHVGRAALRFAELLGATDLPENRPQLFLPAAIAPRGHVVLAPGGGFPAKCWPLENFVKLAAALAPREIVVIGSERDRAAGVALAATGPHVRDLTARLSLAETFAEIAAAGRVVCNSSMAMHAAAAFRRPCCVVLGSWYRSTREHAAQWAHAETRVLGPEPGRGITTVSELLSEPGFW